MRVFLSLLMIALAVQACSPKKEENQQAPQDQGAAYTPQNPKAAVQQTKAGQPQSQLPAAGAPAVANNERVLVEAQFTCTDGSSFSALFKESKVDIVFPKYQPIVLSQDITASGFQYSNSQYKLSGRGKEATWTAGRRTPVNCTTK